MEIGQNKIVKKYPRIGPFQLIRLEQSITFYCFRCQRAKKSRLITIFNEDWEKKLCNGCYGFIISLHTIKKKRESEEKKCEDIIALLNKQINSEEIFKQTNIYKISENRSNFLCLDSIKFIATSQILSHSLENFPFLDWSPAIICICKAFELELVKRVMDPLKEKTKQIELSKDIEDKDLHRVARYCNGEQVKPPEMGTFSYFLQTLINSKKRLTKSNLIMAFYNLKNDWVDSSWIIGKQGLYSSIQTITEKYRNKAVHVESLDKKEFEECKEIIIGKEGVIWKLIFSTMNIKEIKKLDC